MIKGFIFDLDGVIVDTARYHYLAWKRLADELAIPFTEKDNERLKGVSRGQSLDIILSLGHKKLSEQEKHALATKKNNWYVDYIMQMTPAEILPGVLPFLTAAREMKIKTALGSASKNAGTILNKLNLTGFFDVVVTGNEVSKAKPDPEVFLLGAKGLGLPPAACLVFEDAEAGIEAARRGGMKSIGIGSAAVLGKANRVAGGLHELSVEQVLKI